MIVCLSSPIQRHFGILITRLENLQQINFPEILTLMYGSPDGEVKKFLVIFFLIICVILILTTRALNGYSGVNLILV